MSEPLKWEPITREENSWLLDFMREVWKWKDVSSLAATLLPDKENRDMFNRVYNKLAHEEWKFAHHQEGERPR